MNRYGIMRFLVERLYFLTNTKWLFLVMGAFMVPLSPLAIWYRGWYFEADVTWAAMTVAFFIFSWMEFHFEGQVKRHIKGDWRL